MYNKKSILLIVIAISIIFVSGSSFASETDANEILHDVNFENILKGKNSGYDQRIYFVVNSEDEWKQVWNKVHSKAKVKPALPDINFEFHSVVGVFRGKAKDGYDIEITKITEHAGYVNIYLKEALVDKKGSTTQRFHLVDSLKITKPVNFILNVEEPPVQNTVLHRTVKSCADDSPVTIQGVTEQIFPVGGKTGYKNYVCENRKQEQCYRDGSFDTYYDEWCEYNKNLYIIITFYDDRSAVSIKKTGLNMDFTMNTINYDAIIQEIHERTGLSIEEIKTHHENRIR